MIERWLPEKWPQPVLEAMAKFRQGHVLAWNSIAYGATFEHAVSKPTSDIGGDGEGYVKVEDAWPYVIITSQTCDICEEGKKKPRIPWVSVAPVYDILPDLAVKGQDAQIRANGIGYLVPLTGESFTKKGTLWIADLRVEYPLEKSVLVGEEPIAAFATEAEYNEFAEKLAFRRNRPAIDDRVRRFIALPLGNSMRAGIIVHEAILQVRIQCGPSWDHVERARLVAVVRDRESVENVTDQFEAWHGTVKLPQGLTLLPTTVVAYDDFSYKLSRDATPLDLSEVSEN